MCLLTKPKDTLWSEIWQNWRERPQKTGLDVQVPRHKSTHIKPSAFVNGTLTTVQFICGCTGSSWWCSGSLLWKLDDPVHTKRRRCDHSQPGACAVVSHCCSICVSLLTCGAEHLSIRSWAIHNPLLRCRNLLPIFFLQLSLFSLSFKSSSVCSGYKVFIVYKVKRVKSLSCVRLFMTPWTVAYQAPLSMEFSRQEYWSGLHFLLKASSQPRN